MNKPQLINFCEYDKYAVQSYCAIHDVDSSLNLGDITKVNEKEIADFNMMTWGFPCTDISVAGKQKGFIDEDGNKTRSGMYYEGIRILREKKPALSIVENVKALTSKKFKDEFNMVLKDLDEAGYNTYWQILNAKDYGIPQNRERVFLISIRKDLDNGKFVFPKGFDNGLRLKDLLDNEVAEKYYLSEKLQSRFVSKQTLQGGNRQPKILELFKLNENRHSSAQNSVLSTNGICPTIDTMGGGNRQPKILENQQTIDNISDEYSFARSKCQEFYDKNGYLPEMFNPYNQAEITDNAPTQTTMCDRSCSSATVLIKQPNFRIRKLTPKECWKLMGFSSEQFDKAKSEGVSDSQLYKQAGNSIVTYVLYEIYKELYKAMPYLFDDIKLSSFFSGIGAFEIALDMFYNYTITGEEQNFTRPQMD